MSATQVKLNESQQIAKPTTADPVKRTTNPTKSFDTMESMNPEAEGPSSWKVWLANLPWCFGDFFAWLFNIKKDEGRQEISVNRVTQPMSLQAKTLKECVAPFASANPDAVALTKAREAFGQLDVKPKLEVLQELQANPNCTHAHLLPFVKLLAATGLKSPLTQLQVYVEAQRPTNDVRKGADILEANTKDPLVIGAVNAYILDERNKADAERQKKILAQYAGPDFPAADVCRTSVECFVAIEGDKGKLETLQKLMGQDNISDAHVMRFVATLPKAVAKPAESAEAPADAQPAAPGLLRDTLFDKLKTEFGPGEELVQNRYIAASEAHERLNKKKPVADRKPFNEPAPAKFEQLEDYFMARHSNLRIRQKVGEVIVATLKEIA